MLYSTGHCYVTRPNDIKWSLNDWVFKRASFIPSSFVESSIRRLPSRQTKMVKIMITFTKPWSPLIFIVMGRMWRMNSGLRLTVGPVPLVTSPLISQAQPRRTNNMPQINIEPGKPFELIRRGRPNFTTLISRQHSRLAINLPWPCTSLSEVN